MRMQILFLTGMIGTCVFFGCFPPFFRMYEIKDDYVHITQYIDKSDSVNHYYYYYFAESEKTLQDEGYRKYMEPNSYTIFIGDSVEVLLSLPFKPKIRTVKIDGTTYTRHRCPKKIFTGMDGPLDIYVRNNTIKFMRIKLFAEGMGPQR